MPLKLKINYVMIEHKLVKLWQINFCCMFIYNEEQLYFYDIRLYQNQQIQNTSSKQYLFFTLLFYLLFIFQTFYIQVPKMYHIIEKKCSFMHEPAQLLLAVPLCARTVILFYNNKKFFHFSLLEQESLSQSTLPGIPFKAVAISSNRIIVSIIQSRSLLLVDVKEQEIQQICKIPLTNYVINESKSNEIFFLSVLESFKSSGGFFLKQDKVDERKIKFLFMSGQKQIKAENFAIKQYPVRGCITEKIDENCQIAMYRQTPQNNRKFRFAVINLEQQFREEQYLLQHPAFTQYATVRQIKKVGESKYLIVVNSEKPQMLIFQPQQKNKHQFLESFPYSLQRIFMNTILINMEHHYGVFSFLSEFNQQNYLELINLENGKVMESKRCEVKNMVKAWQDDYFLDYQRESKPTTLSHFITRHLLDKKAHYMKIMEHTKMMKDYPSDFLETTLGLL